MYNPLDLDRFSYVRNNPLKYIDSSGHDPKTTDKCGPDGIYCQNNSQIHWDPYTTPKVSKLDKALAEQSYLQALEDPNYFRELYFSTDGSKWGNDEVRYLDFYLQYSNLHTTAEEFILFGMDLFSARVASFFYDSGNPELGDAHLGNAIAQLAAVIPLGLGSTGRTTPYNANEQAAMNQLLENPTMYGKPIRLQMNDGRWPSELGWQKWKANINGVEIHYVYNPLTMEYDDFKFK
jgi:hypothetical protein